MEIKYQKRHYERIMQVHCVAFLPGSEYTVFLTSLLFPIMKIIP